MQAISVRPHRSVVIKIRNITNASCRWLSCRNKRLASRKLLLLSAGLLAISRPAAADGLRESVNLNREWKFQLGDVTGTEAATFDDAMWEDANLPHSFPTPHFAADRFYAGYGWYRKHFDVPASWSGKRINLEYDGVFQVTEVLDIQSVGQ